jgi:hypothetical protein
MIQFSQPEVATHSRVKGSVIWTSEGKPPQALIIMLAWRTEGPEQTNSRVLQKLRHELAPATAGSVTTLFDFEIPADGPISYDGTLIRIVWEVAVVADIAWALDEFERASFRVVPRRRR